MNAVVIHLPSTIDEPARVVCWPCVAIWCGMPLFWVAMFAWAVLHV